MSVRVTVESLVNPTEDEAKVQRALHNLFPSAPIERISRSDDTVTLEAHGIGLGFLATLRSLIKQERIRTAARTVLLRRAGGRGLQLYLNKQAAFVGRVSFCEPSGESPHGPISIRIEAADLQAVVDFLASKPSQEGYKRLHEVT